MSAAREPDGAPIDQVGDFSHVEDEPSQKKWKCARCECEYEYAKKTCPHCEAVSAWVVESEL